MRDLLVLGHDPRYGGGGHAQTQAFLEAARDLGREPELLYAPHPVFGGRRLSLDRVESVRQLRAAKRLTAEAAAARSLWVVATIATAGGAAPRSKRAYDCWIGTTLEDEWRGRRAGLGITRQLAFAASIPALRALERRVLRGARNLFATSAGSRAAVAAAAGVDASRLSILPIPVDVDHLTPESDDEWLARLDRPILAFVGRAWDPRKNVRLLLDALPLVRGHIPGAQVRLIGEPPREPLPEGVVATGPVADLAANLRTASLFVLPSHQEGFGIVAAEALACGVPVVATRSGGPEELITSSQAGRLLDTFSPEELAAVVVELLGDVATLTAMRRRGREYVEREHAPATFRLLLDRALAQTD